MMSESTTESIDVFRFGFRQGHDFLNKAFKKLQWLLSDLILRLATKDSECLFDPVLTEFRK